MAADHFVCTLCSGIVGVGELADLDCSCSICRRCVDEHVLPALAAPAALAGGQQRPFRAGERVRYMHRDHGLVKATVAEVDSSVVPPAYGIMLDGGAGVRFTEQSRLLPLDDEPPALPAVGCPACRAVLGRPQLARLVPEALQRLDDALTAAYLQSRGVICCPAPGCGALIEAEPGSAASAAVGGGGGPCGCNGACSSSCREGHRAAHRFRCASCRCAFCDACRASPYHEGLTCREASAPRCPLCDERVPGADEATAGLSSRQLRERATSWGADCSWALERHELVSVYKHAQQDGCAQRHAAAGDGLCCFCFEPLRSAACILLSCARSHAVHAACALRRLEVGCPGPALTFEHLFCPLCGSGSSGGRCGNIQISTAQLHLQHPLLQRALERQLQLRAQVVAAAKARLRFEKLRLQGAGADPDLLPGGAFDGRPVDWALARWQFYGCSRCLRPYFGGERACAALEDREGAAPFDAAHLVCGACQAQEAGTHCKDHKNDFIEWKCRFCCSPATFFCWGTTHMCAPCHDAPERRRGNVCAGRECPLTVPHPPPGATASNECCLGCGVCRRGDG